MVSGLFRKVAAAALLAAALPAANAAAQLTLSSGGNTVIINDTNGGLDACPLTGCITFVGAIGNWNLNVSTGTVGTNPLIDLNSIDSLVGAGTGANALTITFSSTDFTSPGLLQSSIGGTLSTGASLTYQGYYNANNALNGTTTAIGSLLSFGPGGAFSGSTSGGTATGTYSLTQVVVLSATQNGRSSFDAAIDVPEPGVLALAGLGLGLVGLIGRRRKQ